MNPVQGTPVYTAEKFTDLRDLMVRTCSKYSELDAFIFRRSPKLSEVHRTFFEFGNDIKGLATYILNSKYAGDRLAVVGENAYEWFGFWFKIEHSCFNFVLKWLQTHCWTMII